MKKYIIMFIMLLLPLNIYAATGSIKASSSSSNVTINNTFTVTVKVSSSGKLGSWQFGVSYDKSKLSLVVNLVLYNMVMELFLQKLILINLKLLR